MQLEFAAGQGRCLITFNVADFAKLAAEWYALGRVHCGIVVTPQVGRRKLGQLLARVMSLVNSVAADEMQNVFRYL